MVMRYKGYPAGMAVTDSCMERWWATTAQAKHQETPLPLLATPHCLIELLDGTPLGEFTYALDGHQRASVDVKLARAFWGHGYATEAMTCVLRELFATSAAATVLVEPAAANAPAQRLYQRLGFQPAPTLNHPDRWQCSRLDFADRLRAKLAEVA
jgi:RimJ/RimL family protein N-acetyltransferase